MRQNRYLGSDAIKKGKPIKAVLKRWTNGRDRIYEYIERTIPIAEFALIGPAQNERIASIP